MQNIFNETIKNEYEKFKIILKELKERVKKSLNICDF
jgi:hypothetical protein